MSPGGKREAKMVFWTRSVPGRRCVVGPKWQIWSPFSLTGRSDVTDFSSALEHWNMSCSFGAKDKKAKGGKRTISPLLEAESYNPLRSIGRVHRSGSGVLYKLMLEGGNIIRRADLSLSPLWLFLPFGEEEKGLAMKRRRVENERHKQPSMKTFEEKLVAGETRGFAA